MSKTIPIYILLLSAIVFPLSAAWEFIGPNYAISNLYSFGNGHILIFKEQSDTLYRSRDYGNTWSTVSNTQLPRLASVRYQIFNYNNKLWLGILRRGLYYTIDSGNTWTQDTLIRCGGDQAYSFAAKDSILLVGTYCFFSRSIDYGKTWQNYIKTPAMPFDFGAAFCFLVFRDIVYAGTQLGVFASKDWGLKWEIRGLNYLNAPGATIYSIERIDTTLFISSITAISKTHNFGINDSWNSVKYMKGATELLLIDSSKIYASEQVYMNGKLFYSSDTCKTFTQINVSDSPICINRCVADDKYIYVLTMNGIYRNLKNEDPITKIIEKPFGEFAVKLKITLNAGVLSYSLQEPSFTTIAIYNTMGRRILYIQKAAQYAGRHKINLHGYKYSAGVYAIKFQTGKNTFTGSFILE